MSLQNVVQIASPPRLEVSYWLPSCIEAESETKSGCSVTVDDWLTIVGDRPQVSTEVYHLFQAPYFKAQNTLT